MKQAAFFALALVCLPGPLHAQSPFDGTWRFGREATHTSGIRYGISLQGGVFTCRWCKPVWSVPADGAFHPVIGQSRYDAASVQVVDNSTAVFTRKRNGRTFYQAIDVISEDETWMSFSFTEISDEGKVESGTGLWKRLCPKPPGAHPVTGEWRELWVKETSDRDVTFTILTKGDVVRIEYAPDEIVSASFGGPATKVEGDPRRTMASLKRLGANGFVQTDFRGGQIVSVVTSRLLNPVTMEIVVENTRDGSQSRYTAHRQ